VNKYKYILIILIVLIVFDLIFGYTDKSFYAYFLDVGQGEATLIRTPEGKYVLIDTGAGRASYEELSRYFPVGDNRIDLLIISHFDADHIGALPLVLEGYNITSVLYNELDPDYSGYWEAYLKPYNKIEGDIRVGCCVLVDILQSTTDLAFKDSNEASLAFKVDFQNLDLFFGGDLPSGLEDDLAKSIGDIDVLKVSHHGSRNSTSDYFLTEIKPEIAIISVGRNNSYGHPHGRVLEALTKHEVYVARTDSNGTQVIISDGYSWELISSNGCEQYCSYLLFLKKLLLSEHSLNYL
jgi:competence protein ComEC